MVTNIKRISAIAVLLVFASASLCFADVAPHRTSSFYRRYFSMRPFDQSNTRYEYDDTDGDDILADEFDEELEEEEEIKHFARKKAQESGLEQFAPEDLPKDYSKNSQIILDADQITYDDAGGIVTATGNAQLNNEDLLLMAPKIVYNSKEEKVYAYSDGLELVRIISSTQDEMCGTALEYDTAAKHGIISDVSGKTGELKITGNDGYVMTAGEAVETKTAKKSHVGGSAAIKKEHMIGNVTEVYATTCDLEKPHYHITSKRAVIVPGKRMVLKKAKLYFGDRMFFAYPFDLICRLGKQTNTRLMPVIGYSSSKGAGVGVNGYLNLGDYGSAKVGATQWTEGITEANIHYRKRLTNRLSFYTKIRKRYNKSSDSALWRPEYGFVYRRRGWTASVRMSERSLTSTTMTPGSRQEYDVWRKPEFTVTSPWFLQRATPLLKLRVSAGYGKYQENRRRQLPEIERYSWTLLLSSNLGNDVKIFDFFNPYYGLRYRYFDYKYNDYEQKVTDYWVGVNYLVGSFRLGTTYFHRFRRGNSPMGWDRYYDNKILYQGVEVPLPIGDEFNKWRVYGGVEYDVSDHEFSTITYRLAYERHCYTWEFWGWRELGTGGDSRMGLTFFINAYPEDPLDFGSDLY